jgi:hypothetical protein
METKIIVIYIGIAGVRSEDIDEYVNKVTNKISPTTLQCEVITIPVQDVNTRIECINPNYITDEILINEHTKMMKNLQEEFNILT